VGFGLGGLGVGLGWFSEAGSEIGWGGLGGGGGGEDANVCGNSFCRSFAFRDGLCLSHESTSKLDVSAKLTGCCWIFKKSNSGRSPIYLIQANATSNPGQAELQFLSLFLITLRLPRAVHPLKVFFTFNAHLEFSYFSY
jgi:hypothetical protein